MPRTDIDIPLPDLSGRRAVVTGGSDGIGLHVATRLAAAGAEVVLPVRNRAKGEAAATQVRRAVPGSIVQLQTLDLSSLASVAALGEALRVDGAPIHLLVNNAGVMTPPHRQTTLDDHELQLGTNHLGHVALVAHLLPLLRAGGARITSQISVAAARGRIDLEDLEGRKPYEGMRAYRQSKIALGLFGLELDRRSRSAGWGISSNLSHPGVAPTSLLAARPELERTADTTQVRLIRALSRRGLLVGTPATAALPALMAAAHPDSEGGRLYGPRGFLHTGGAPGEQRLYRPLRDASDAARVWAVSKRLAGVAFPTEDSQARTIQG